jgi:hypothetical protein
MGEMVWINTGIMITGCGVVAFNAEYWATATDEYWLDARGIERRKFLYAEGCPVCDCCEEAWLSNDRDVPVLVEDWPVRKPAEIPQGGR